jgi:hypothetical protein
LSFGGEIERYTAKTPVPRKDQNFTAETQSFSENAGDNMFENQCL